MYMYIIIPQGESACMGKTNKHTRCYMYSPRENMIAVHPCCIKFVQVYMYIVYTCACTCTVYAHLHVYMLPLNYTINEKVIQFFHQRSQQMVGFSSLNHNAARSMFLKSGKVLALVIIR